MQQLSVAFLPARIRLAGVFDAKLNLDRELFLALETVLVASWVGPAEAELVASGD